MSNHIRRFKRPEYIAHRDFTAIECLPDDCLLKDYDVARTVEGRHARLRARPLFGWAVLSRADQITD